MNLFEKNKKIISALFLLIFFLLPLSNAYAACSGVSVGGFTLSTGDCNTSVDSSSASGGFDPSGLDQYGLPNGSLTGIIVTIMDWLLGMLGVFGILGFLISGVMYLLSAGDDDLIKRAKTTMKWSIVGVIVGMLGLIVVNVVFNLLNADVTNI